MSPATADRQDANRTDGVGVAPLVLRLDAPVDPAAQPVFRRERAIEDALLAIRASRAARQAAGSGCAGALVVFPTVVYGPFQTRSGCGAAGQWPVALDHEPGSLFEVGDTVVRWEATIASRPVHGEFTVAVGDDARPAPPAACWEGRGRRQEPVASPYRSLSVPAAPSTALRRTAAALEAQADEGRLTLVRLSERLLHKIIGRYHGSFSADYDHDDAFQDAVAHMLSLVAERFASQRRPAAAWGRVVAVETNKHVGRAVARSKGVGRPERAVRQLLAERPDLASAPVDELRQALRLVTSEADVWSDRRIVEAVGGPPTLMAIDDVGQLPANSSDVADQLDVIADLFADPRRLDAAAPWLAAEGLVAGNRPSSSVQITRAKKAFISALAGKLGVRATTSQELVEAFAAPGESYGDPAARTRMQARARAAIVAQLSGERSA